MDTNQAYPYLKKNRGNFYEGTEEAFNIKDSGTYHTQANGSRVSGDNLFKTTSVPLVTVEGDGGSLIRKSKDKSSLKLIISLNNSPDVWQAATELTGLATGYGKKGLPTEWARNGCNLRVETNNYFMIETFDQSYANSPKHNVTGSKYEEQTRLRTAKIGTEIVDKFSLTSDGNATNVATLSVKRLDPAEACSSTHGYAAGGWDGSTFSNIIDKFTFASDNDATDVGDLTQLKSHCAGQQY